MNRDDEREFNWGSFAGKTIVAIAVILVVVWCLFLANKGIKSSLGVLTNNIFAENIDRMKEVGKSYFTNERLPQKIGEIKTLSLAEMYEQKLILKVKDKDGHACSPNNSYVSVEKYNEYEYHMRIYLECGEESDHILVILGCYDYCKDKVCEKQDDIEKPEAQEIEYQYVKTKGGYWTDYGKWSEWSKVPVTETDYRDVETKEETEKYEYDKTIVDEIYTSYKTSCPEGYSKTSDGDKCFKTIKDTIYVDANSCPYNYNGYTLVEQDGLKCKYAKEIVDYKEPNRCSSTYNGMTLVSQNGFNCVYSKNDTVTVNPNKCSSTYNGMTLVSQNGFNCVYSKNDTVTVNPNKCPNTYNGMPLKSQNGFTCYYEKINYKEANPVCPRATNGFNFVSQNGFNCNYNKSSEYTKNPVCPSGTNGYSFNSRNGFTCNYSKTYQESYQVAVTKKVIPCTGCAPKWVTIYETRYRDKTATDTKTASCPSGTYKSGNTCVGYNNQNKVLNASCPSGYYKSNDKCVINIYGTVETETNCPNGYSKNGNICSKNDYKETVIEANCPSGYSKNGNMCSRNDYKETVIETNCPNGYSKNGNMCVKTTGDIINKEASCPNGYYPSRKNNNCYKNTENNIYEEVNKYCPNGYKDRGEGNGCYKEEEKTEHIVEDRIVKYYRYRLREYKGQTIIDYKWSSSNNDKDLLNKGYRLTGKTRIKGGK